ncbi:hypothetical protein ACFQ0B_19605 [Nonomuraea thailandensis]
MTFSQSLADELSAKLDLLIEDEVVRKRVEVDNAERLAVRIVAGAEGRRPRWWARARARWPSSRRTRSGCCRSPQVISSTMWIRGASRTVTWSWTRRRTSARRSGGC